MSTGSLTIAQGAVYVAPDSQVLSYQYVVGSGGNYAGTPAGLQAAITAAAGSPVFIQKGFAGTDPVTVTATTKLVGAVNENPANSDIYFSALPSFDTGTTANTTILTCPLVLPTTGVNLSMENICYAPPAALFSVSTGTTSTFTVSLNNCKAMAEGGNAFTLIVTANATATLNLYLNNTTMGDFGNQNFITLTNNGADSLSAINAIVSAVNGSSILFTDQSLLTGYGIGLRVNVVDSYHAAPIKYISGNLVSISLAFLNAIIGEAGLGQSLTTGTYANLYISQMQDTTFIYSSDYVGSEIPLIKDLPSNLVGSFDSFPQNVSFVNCLWSAQAAVLSAFTDVANGWILSKDRSLNVPLGKFTTILSGLSVAAKTEGVGAPYSVLTTESLKAFTNEGAGAKVYLTLPTASANLIYTGVVQDADGLRITANTGDTIRISSSVSGAAGYCESTTIGSTVMLLAINATEWVSISTNGTWSVV